MALGHAKKLGIENLQEFTIFPKEVVDGREAKEKLEKVCKSLQNKYGYIMRRFKQKDDKLFVSIEVENGSYSTFCCLSYYESMCKYILFVKACIDNKKIGVK